MYICIHRHIAQARFFHARWYMMLFSRSERRLTSADAMGIAREFYLSKRPLLCAICVRVFYFVYVFALDNTVWRRRRQPDEKLSSALYIYIRCARALCACLVIPISQPDTGRVRE